jgi:hypothetical protein
MNGAFFETVNENNTHRDANGMMSLGQARKYF